MSLGRQFHHFGRRQLQKMFQKFSLYFLLWSATDSQVMSFTPQGNWLLPTRAAAGNEAMLSSGVCRGR